MININSRYDSITSFTIVRIYDPPWIWYHHGFGLCLVSVALILSDFFNRKFIFKLEDITTLYRKSINRKVRETLIFNLLSCFGRRYLNWFYIVSWFVIWLCMIRNKNTGLDTSGWVLKLNYACLYFNLFRDFDVPYKIWSVLSLVIPGMSTNLCVYSAPMKSWWEVETSINCTTIVTSIASENVKEVKELIILTLMDIAILSANFCSPSPT